MKLNYWLLLIVILLFSCQRRHGMTYEEPGTSPKTIFKSRMLGQPDSILIYLSLYNPELHKDLAADRFLDRYRVEYVITPGRHNPETLFEDSLSPHRSHICREDQTFYVSFAVPRLSSHPSGNLVVKITDRTTQKSEFIGMILDFKTNTSLADCIFYNRSSHHPVIDNYFLCEDSVCLTTGNPQIKQVTVQRLGREFPPAAKPFDNNADDEKSGISIDTTFTIPTGATTRISKCGLYLIRPDSSSSSRPFLFLVKSNKYPQITTPEDLIDPLFYIVTPAEMATLKKSVSPKISADSFWLSLGGSKDYSRHLIKNYYEKVEYCNKMFTSCKEGWKTDRGMIYIVFGKPDLIYRSEGEEEWVYENILTHIISFSFVKKETLFLSQDYELVRHPYYQKYWNSAIEKWRSGIITK